MHVTITRHIAAACGAAGSLEIDAIYDRLTSFVIVTRRRKIKSDGVPPGMAAGEYPRAVGRLGGQSEQVRLSGGEAEGGRAREAASWL